MNFFSTLKKLLLLRTANLSSLPDQMNFNTNTFFKNIFNGLHGLGQNLKNQI